MLFLPILQELNDRHVSYVIVGGLATVLHGYLRITADIDIVVELEKENILRAVDALESVGLRPRLPEDPRRFADAQVREQWIEQKNMMVFSWYKIDNPLVSVDLFIHYPMDYVSLYSQACHLMLQGVVVRVCSLKHLIELKQAAGRPKDLDDVRVLRIIQENQND